MPHCYAAAKWVGSEVGTAHCNALSGMPDGDVPFGESCSVGQYRGASIFFMACRQSKGRFRFFLTHIFKEGSRLSMAARLLCPVPFAGLN